MRRLTLLSLLLWAAAPTAVGADPRIDYLLHCGGCHLENGSGDPPIVPDLRADLDRLLAAPGGRAYLAQVPGSSQAPLDDAALAGVLNYIVREYGRGTAETEPFTEQEIARYRGTTLLDPLAARRRLLEP
jgi:hypothetical protein